EKDREENKDERFHALAHDTRPGPAATPSSYDREPCLRYSVRTEILFTTYQYPPSRQTRSRRTRRVRPRKATHRSVRVAIATVTLRWLVLQGSDSRSYAGAPSASPSRRARRRPEARCH